MIPETSGYDEEEGRELFVRASSTPSFTHLEGPLERLTFRGSEIEEEDDIGIGERADRRRLRDLGEGGGGRREG